MLFGYHMGYFHWLYEECRLSLRSKRRSITGRGPGLESVFLAGNFDLHEVGKEQCRWVLETHGSNDVDSNKHV